MFQVLRNCLRRYQFFKKIDQGVPVIKKLFKKVLIIKKVFRKIPDIKNCLKRFNLSKSD